MWRACLKHAPFNFQMTISPALKSPLILRTISRKFGGYKLNIAFIVALLVFFSLHHSLRNSTGQQETLADPSEVVPNETSPTDILWNGVFVNLKTEEISEDVIRAVITITGKSSIVENGTKNAIKMFTGGFNSIEDSDENFDDINEKFTDEITSAVEIVHEEVYEVIDETVLKPKTLEKLKDILQCENRSYASRIMQRGEYWVFVNYVKADHGELPCHSHITLTTQGDHIFLDNVEPLLKAWDSPVSLAIHASGYDLSTAVDSIRYLRDCGEAANLVKKWVTFHVLFHKDHIPKEIPPIEEVLSNPFNCSLPAPFLGDASLRYSANHSLKYPINLARNVAREAAMTHFIFPSDIELYPTPKLNERFLNMIAREPPTINGTNPKVFPLAVFEVRYNEVAAKNKSELQTMLKEQRAFTFHALMCPYCHNVPRVNEWIAEEDTGQLDIFTLGKRVGPHRVWEPFFIGTQDEPLFDERLTWDGKSDKMPQNYIMCLLNYDYLVLKNVFLTHKPGVKKRVADKLRDAETEKTDHLIGHVMRKELDYIYGARAGCILGNISYYTTRAPNT